MSKDLEHFIYSLSEDAQLKLALQLATEIMPVWENFSVLKEDLHFIDTISGTPRDVDAQLLPQALSAAISVSSATNDAAKSIAMEDVQLVWEKFGVPIAALQTMDWEVPYPVERTIYSIYNIIEFLHGMKSTTHDESTLYVSINQSIDTLIHTGRKEAEDIIDMLDQFGEFSE